MRGIVALLWNPGPLVLKLRRTSVPRIPVNKGKSKGRGCYAPVHVPQPPRPGHIAQTVNAREFTYATCCALHTLVACQREGRGFGIESTADVLLTSPSTRTSCASRFYGFCRKNERADERTRTADPISYE